MLPVSVSPPRRSHRRLLGALLTGVGALGLVGASLVAVPGCRNGAISPGEVADPFAASLQVEATTSERRALEEARLHLAASTAENERKDRELADLRARCERLQRQVDATEARISENGLYAVRLPAPLRRAVTDVTRVYGDWVRFDGATGTLTLQSDFTFIAGQHTLTPDATAALHELATALVKPGIGQVEIVVAAHTDRKPIPLDGPSGRRERLVSAEHAISVVETLVASGVPMEHLAIAAWGDSRPLTGNDDPSGRFANRRIELQLTLRPQAPSTTATIDTTQVPGD